MSRLRTDARTTECEDRARILETEFAKLVEKLVEKLVMVATSFVMVATSFVMVATSLVMVLTSLVMVSTPLVIVSTSLVTVRTPEALLGGHQRRLLHRNVQGQWKFKSMTDL